LPFQISSKWRRTSSLLASDIISSPGHGHPPAGPAD
jgi:hypothetical protein